MRDFFAAMAAGELPDSMLTEDMHGWITTQGKVSKVVYQQMIKLLARMCAQPLTFTIESITAEGDRVIAEAHSTGTLINGESYQNTYVFVLRVRDGRIASIAEHYNALIAQQKLVPVMQQLSKSP